MIWTIVYVTLCMCHLYAGNGPMFRGGGGMFRGAVVPALIVMCVGRRIFYAFLPADSILLYRAGTFHPPPPGTTAPHRICYLE